MFDSTSVISGFLQNASQEFFVVAESPEEAFNSIQVAISFATPGEVNALLDDRCKPGSVRPKIMRVTIVPVIQ